jgi:putative aldouronate transport system permease protein
VLRKDGLLSELKRNKQLFVMLVPALLIVVVFNYLPMSGLLLAFKNYQYNLGIFDSPWAGLENFNYFFASGTGLQVTWNTIYFNVINLVTSQLLAIVIAIVFNEMRAKHFKKVSQSIIFLPYFVSWIIVGAFVYNIFNFESGTMNSTLRGLGMEPVDMYGSPDVWVYVIVFFNSWKWVGYNSIIYIAAISGIDQECYEAADIDGANVWQKIQRITIPSIMPTIIIILLLNVGRILRGDFQMYYQIIGNNGQLFNATDVIDTFVFRSLITTGDIGMTAAATFYQSVFCFITIWAVNALVKRNHKEYALF